MIKKIVICLFHLKKVPSRPLLFLPHRVVHPGLPVLVLPGPAQAVAGPLAAGVRQPARPVPRRPRRRLPVSEVAHAAAVQLEEKRKGSFQGQGGEALRLEKGERKGLSLNCETPEKRKEGGI